MQDGPQTERSSGRRIVLTVFGALLVLTGGAWGLFVGVPSIFGTSLMFEQLLIDRSLALEVGIRGLIFVGCVAAATMIASRWYRFDRPLLSGVSVGMSILGWGVVQFGWLAAPVVSLLVRTHGGQIEHYSPLPLTAVGWLLLAGSAIALIQAHRVRPGTNARAGEDVAAPDGLAR